MNKIIISGLFALLAIKSSIPATKSAWAAVGGKKYVITHFNITFSPDLSNRVNPQLYKRPLNDAEVLKIVTSNLYPTILRHRRSENQKDKFLVDFVNKSLISQYSANTDKLFIDFGRFSRQNDRIAYILGRDHVKRTLKLDVAGMQSEFNRIHTIASKRNFGADIWTYLSEGIDNKKVLSAEKEVTEGNNTYVNAYRNVLIITTDGYIEAGIFGKGFDLSQKTINRFRKSFLASGQDDIQLFFKKNKQFRIKPVHNENLKNLEVLVMELYDRSKSQGGAATVHPTDMEIIRLFWADWLQQSKVKRFELHPYSNSKDEAEKIILNFLQVKF